MHSRRRALHHRQASQQSRLLTLDFRRAPTTHRATAGLALALRAQSRRNPAVHELLSLPEPFEEDPEGDDGEAGEDERVQGVDVPGAEDDAGILDLSVPKS